MPKLMDLDRERQIRGLRAQGLGVRQIAARIGATPSTVSRLLRGSVDHAALVEITARLERVEASLDYSREVAKQLIQALPVGSPFRSDLYLLLQRWPVSTPSAAPKTIQVKVNPMPHSQ